MPPDVLATIRREHAATVKAVQHAQARAVTVGELLLEIRGTMDLFKWVEWLDSSCPIDKSTAHRYLNQARMRRKAA